MTIPGNANPLLLKAPAGGGGGEYTIERSVRFNSSDSAYLSRTPASAGNRKTWTWAGWVKPTKLGTYRGILEGYTGTPAFANRTSILLGNLDQIDVLFDNASSGRITTTAVFRDPSAWYHIVFACDTTQATASNRFKLYVNGGQVTVFSTASYPAQNYDTGINTTQPYYMGRVVDPLYADFYLADIHLIDGQALDPTSFGEFDDNGIWQPIAYSGSYGTNGFHLPFDDNSTAAALGTDTSGAGNNWTVNNISNVSGGPTSVASASGALPIYNTTDTYGTTKGTGTRTDSNSSSIVLAVAMDGANNGTTFTDESATIKGSGIAKTVTAYGNTKTITSESKFYGSSADFASDGTDYLGVPHSSDLNLNSATNFTIEAWVYADTNRTYNYFVSKGSATTREWALATTATNVIFYWSTNGVGSGDSVISISHTVATARWNHIAAVKLGSTITLYVNGISIGSGSFTSGYIGTSPLYVGRFMDYTGISHSLDGKINDLRIYNGIAKYTSNFNPPSSTQNATIAVGNDSLVDVPTNGTETDTGIGGQVRGNYATLNPLARGVTALSNGNLQFDYNATYSVPATIGVASGKWYFEALVATQVSAEQVVGVVNGSWNNADLVGGNANGWGIIVQSNANNGQAYHNSSVTSSYATYANGDTAMVAFDVDAGKIWFGRNGTWFDSGNPASGTGNIYSNLAGTIFPAISNRLSTGGVIHANFGQRPFAYTAPSGFKALNTANLPAPVITKPSTVMGIVQYTGNSSTQTVTGLDFNPDFIWSKSRSGTFGHGLFDSVRGVSRALASHSTNAEGVGATGTGVTAFNSNGFSLGPDDGAFTGYINYTGSSQVAWCWDAGSSTVTNTDGSITSQVRANPSAGFSIVSYTGSGSNATVGHGLGVAPAMIMFKKRSNTQNWVVYHSAMGATKALYLDQTVAAVTSSNFFQDTQPTSSVFSLGTGNGVNTISQTFIAYCFAPVESYSAFGSYIGNGSSTDGPFVYTGFRPRWILVKSTGATGWAIIDAARDAYNLSTKQLFPHDPAAEFDSSTQYLVADLLSNGFKLRTTSSASNTSSQSYVYCAFAESPFQYSRAR